MGTLAASGLTGASLGRAGLHQCAATAIRMDAACSTATAGLHGITAATVLLQAQAYVSPARLMACQALLPACQLQPTATRTLSALPVDQIRVRALPPPSGHGGTLCTDFIFAAFRRKLAEKWLKIRVIRVLGPRGLSGICFSVGFFSGGFSGLPSRFLMSVRAGARRAGDTEAAHCLCEPLEAGEQREEGPPGPQ